MALTRPAAAYEAFGVDLDLAPQCADAQLDLQLCRFRRGQPACAHEEHAARECLQTLSWALDAQLVTQAYWRDPQRALRDRLAPSYEQSARFGLLRRFFPTK